MKSSTSPSTASTRRRVDVVVDTSSRPASNAGRSPGRAGLASTRVVSPANGNAAASSPSAAGLASVRGTVLSSVRGGLHSTRGSDKVRPTNVQLALDPLMPSSLLRDHKLWRWMLLNAIILGLYAGAFVLAGYAQPSPKLTYEADKLTIAGWVSHVIGALLFLFSVLALFIKKGPFFPKLLTSYLFALIFFVVGTVLHTTHLGFSAQFHDLLAINPNATLADVTYSTDVITSSINTSDKATSSVQLQWLAGVVFYLFLTVLVWKAPASSANIATPDEINKHKLLMELRELAQFNAQLTAQMNEEAQQPQFQMPKTPQKSPQQGSVGGAPNILILDRPTTGGTDSRPATSTQPPAVSSSSSNPLLSSQRPNSSQPLTDQRDHAGLETLSVHRRQALQVQQALEEEARSM